jgi:hypothetical protein
MLDDGWAPALLQSSAAGIRPRWPAGTERSHDRETMIMATGKRLKRVRRIVDLLVVDSEDRPILLGEVKANGEHPEAAYSQLMTYLQAGDLAAPFVMIVNPDKILIYRNDGQRLRDPDFSAETASILGYYSTYFDEFKAKGMGEFYLLTLVKAWLRDLSYQWKSKSSPPPGSEALDKLGLVPLLKDAMIDSKVSVGGYRIYRD